jgi:hypothetical protein
MVMATNIWVEIKKLQGKNLATLDRRQKFKVMQVLPSQIIIETSTGASRNIPWNNVQQSWIELEKNGEITRTDIMRLYSPFNPAYVAAILSNLPNVSHSVRPIVLKLSKSKS